jgi:mannose-6-phosphate isomerase-like protein (cupin superfamily)
VADYTTANLRTDVPDQAPNFGFAPDMEAHFARQTLELEQSGAGYEKLSPGFRMPFGHTHSTQEEVYVVVAGSGRMKIGDDIVDLGPLDAVRVAAGVWRCTEAGPDGLEVVAFGARCGMGPEDNDAEIEQGWWSD